LAARPLSAEVAALRTSLDPARSPDLAPFDAKRAFGLYAKIVAPAAALLDGAHQVFVVPDGAPGFSLVGSGPNRDGGGRILFWPARVGGWAAMHPSLQMIPQLRCSSVFAITRPAKKLQM